MNEEDDVNVRNNSSKLSQVPQSSKTVTSRELEDAESPTWSKYDIFFYIINYTVMFLSRLGKDLIKSALDYFYSEHLIPEHILDLTKTSKKLHLENNSRKEPCIRHLSWIKRIKFSIRKYLRAFKSYMLTSEDDRNFHCSKNVVVDKEKSYSIPDLPKQFCPKSVINKTPTENTSPSTPSTSKKHVDESLKTEFKDSKPTTRAQNHDSDSEDDDSIVIAYLKEKDLNVDVEISSTRKNISVLEKVPKMETIPEGEQFVAFQSPSLATDVKISPECKNADKDKLSFNIGSEHSIESLERDPYIAEAIAFLHEDKDFLIAAETGNHKILEILIRKGANIQQMDHLGRNALHLAGCSDSEAAVMLLLKARINTNVKDNLGMTPLSLCLMRRPSYKIANLLFDYGAKIAPRSNPVDTGLFLQFVMMCTPTEEDINILQLLVEKGAIVNDPEAPGGRQALHFAAMSNNCRLIRILVDLGADLTFTNHRNETPKNVAGIFKCKKAYKLLSEIEYDEYSLESVL